MNDEENKFAAALKSNLRQVPVTGGDGTDRRQVHVGAYFSPEVARQLKILGAEEGATMRMLMAEALDMLFSSRGRPAIARDPSKETDY